MNGYCQDYVIPPGHICGHESISRWYGFGGDWIERRFFITFLMTVNLEMNVSQSQLLVETLESSFRWNL